MSLDRQSGQHRKTSTGRHRPSNGTSRIVDDGSGVWTIVPIATSTAPVGRVGALAVALGVGVAIAGIPAVAAADDTGSTESAQGSLTGAASSAARSPRGGARVAQAESPADNSDSQSGATARRSGLGSSKGRTGIPRSLAGDAQAPDSKPGSALAPVTSVPSGTVTVETVDLPTGLADTPSVEVSPAATVPVVTPAATVEIEPPAMTTAPSTDLVTDGSVSTDVDGDAPAPAAPLIATLALATVGMTRRETLAAATTVAPADVVTTGEPIDPPGPVDPSGEASASLVAEAPVEAEAPTIDWNIIHDLLEAARVPVTEAFQLLIVKDLPIAEPIAGTLANTAFNVLAALVEADWGTVENQITGLATDQGVLQFVAGVVGNALGAKTTENPNALGLPQGLADTVGNGAAYFVEHALGSDITTGAIIDVLKNVPIPTTLTGLAEWIGTWVGSGFDLEATLRDLIGETELPSLIDFFGSSNVQDAFGDAIGGTINVILGQVWPPFASQPQPDQPALATYAGDLVATLLMGADNPAFSQVSAVIAGNVTQILAVVAPALSGVVSDAYSGFMAYGNVNQILATNTLNALLAAIDGDLLPPAPGTITDAVVAVAEDAVVQLFGSDNTATWTNVSSLLGALIGQLTSIPDVDIAVGAKVSQLVAGLLPGNPIADDLGYWVGVAVTELLIIRQSPVHWSQWWIRCSPTSSAKPVW